MKKRKFPEISGRLVLFILLLGVGVSIFLSYTTGFDGGVIKNVANSIFVPMEKGISAVSERLLRTAEETATLEALTKENEELKGEVDRLNSEISGIILHENELEELRSLLALKHTYIEYETTGAYIIGRNSNNFYNTFIIDKGSEDGIKKDMNILAGNGLVGIVTSVGKTHSFVRAVIDDTSSVAGMISDTGDNLVVNGSLETMTNEGMITFSNLEDLEGNIKVGDTIVTSNVSDKYLPGILIGYISEINDDANGLTKKGKIIPVSDFKHINEVLVVMTVKEDVTDVVTEE